MTTRTAGARVLAVFVLAAGALAGCASEPKTPANIATSAEETNSVTLRASGSQVYQCSAVNGSSATTWTFKAPDADLFDRKDEKVGHHSAGPTWELLDGSKLTAHVLAKAPSPDGKGIDWLLLDVKSAAGPSFANVNLVQRVDTVGGQAPPSGGCAMGEEKRVPYAAMYKFYVRNSAP